MLSGDFPGHRASSSLFDFSAGKFRTSATHSRPLSVFARQRNDAVPAGGGSAVIFQDEFGENVFAAIIGGNPVQQAVRGVPIAGKKGIEGLIVGAKVGLGEAAVGAFGVWRWGGGDQFGDNQRRFQAIGADFGHPADAAYLRGQLLADCLGCGFVDENRYAQ